MPQLAAEKIRQLGDRPAFDNSKGLDFLEDMQQRMSRLEVRLQQHTYLIGQLTAQSDKYIAIRERFLDVFNKNVLDIRSLESGQIITAGKVTAPRGDCVTDAQLYRDGRRQDDLLMIRLYGLPWHKILELYENGNDACLAILDQYATFSANPSGTMSPHISHAFTQFIQLLVSDTQTNPARNPHSPLGMTVSRFWRACEALRG